MSRYLGVPVDRAALSKLPPPSQLGQALQWIIPLALAAAVYFGVDDAAGKHLEELVYAWVLPTAVLAGIFTALAGARPLTVLVTTLVAPFTTLLPAIAAGMIAAPMEAWLRRPTVADCEGVPDAITSLGGIYGNRFTRVLLVFVLSNLGASLGAYVGAGWVAKILLR
jgi:pheromone shutdown protein TraB